jgi:DNA repair protein RecO (recombination protein O)
MHYTKLTGIIINRRSVGDADRFLTILTPEQGKLSVYARGIRSAHSHRRASLDLFTEIAFEIRENRGKTDLVSVELIDSHAPAKAALGDIARLFQLGELVDALVPEAAPETEVYALLQTALAHLPRFDTPEYVFRFKRKLLQLLGYWDSELDAQSIDPYLESLIQRPLRARQIG